MSTIKHDPVRELTEIRNQLSYSKRIGFLFGAGTSKSMGISDISGLTAQIEKNISKDLSPKLDKIKAQLDPDQKHVEGILNQIRLIRQITCDSKDKSFDGINGEEAKDLDKSICDEIYTIISEEEEKADVKTAKKFIGWLNWLSRDFPKEIFTTNYDLILEKSFEDLFIPFYDGFIGSHEPFFAYQTIENKTKYDRPPTSWIRLWKLHGSLGWFWKNGESGETDRVIRLAAGSKVKYPDSELVIYPSKDKYESSRKQPFTSYFDRLKDFLLDGEGIFIISGYSFSDEHVNEVIFNSLNQNNRIHVIAFFYSDKSIEQIIESNKNIPNFTLISPSKASISGIAGEWEFSKGGEILDPFWDTGKSCLTIGDFKKLVDFFILSSGMKED